MISTRKIYLVVIALSGFVFPCGAGMGGIRPAVHISPQNVHIRKDPKIKAADVEFDLRTAALPQSMAPTLDRLANEIAILVNNLYKRRELDEVNVRSLMRIRFYLAAIYRQTKQQKLKARIEEAVREINEELRHRLDFEERYRSGLVRMPVGKSFSTTGTQTDSEVMVEKGNSLFSQRTIRGVDSGIGAEERPSRPTGMSPGVQSKLRAAAQRARDKVAEKRSINRTGLPARQRALLDLVESGRIDINQLTQKDRDFVNAYLNPSSVGGSESEQQRPIDATRSQPSPDVPQVDILPKNLDRAGLSTRQRALLDLVESGKMDRNQLNPKDRALVNEYLPSVDLSTLPPPPPELLEEPRDSLESFPLPPPLQ